MNSEIGLIIFDCDGVLVDSEELSSRLLAKALTDQGYRVTPEDCRVRYTGISMRSVIEMVEADWGRKLPADFEERVREHDIEVFGRELKAIPRMADALTRISLPVCVASSGAPEKIHHSLTVTELLDFFAPHLFSAHMVERGKPAPDVFLLAAEKMGVASANCCVVEDSEAGVTGARAAGMRVLGFTGGSHTRPGDEDGLKRAGADIVFDDMAQLPGLVNAQTPARG